jgi:hypothetical protein
MAGNMWKVQPVYVTAIEILQDKGSISDVELFDALRAFYKEIGLEDLEKTLMRMEITGLVSVSSLTKDRRLVQLIKK